MRGKHTHAKSYRLRASTLKMTQTFERFVPIRREFLEKGRGVNVNQIRTKKYMETELFRYII